MGIGNSQQFAELKPRGQASDPNRRNRKPKRRRRGLFRRARSASPTQPVIPVRRRPSHRYSYGAAPYGLPIYPLARQSLAYPGFMPTPYNNYNIPGYLTPQQQLMMMSPQQYQAMLSPEEIYPFQPFMLPQQVQQPMFPPYMSSPYSAGVPPPPPYIRQQPPPPPYIQQQPPPQMQPYYNNVGAYAPMSTPYAQPQPQIQPAYNNVGVSAPISMPYIQPPSAPIAPSVPSPVRQYGTTSARVITDWTRGGVISPGFLGPPI
jgi:hypothetical protein